jgi:hypothetical protein
VNIFTSHFVCTCCTYLKQMQCKTNCFRPRENWQRGCLSKKNYVLYFNPLLYHIWTLW